MWLVLFDVDGTLFLTDDQLANEAAVAAVRDVYGIDLPPDCVSQVDHPGRTTRSIFREVLLRAGLDPAEVDFPFTDPSAFEDLESGDQLPVVPDAFADQYRSMIQAHIAELSSRASAQRMDYMLLQTSMPLDFALF